LGGDAKREKSERVRGRGGPFYRPTGATLREFCREGALTGNGSGKRRVQREVLSLSHFSWKVRGGHKVNVVKGGIRREGGGKPVGWCLTRGKHLKGY